MREDEMMDELIEAIRFYSAGFEPVINNAKRGIIYKPTERLLDDCGNKANEIIRKYDKAFKS